MLAFVSAPADTLAFLSSCPALPFAYSLWGNDIGAEGALAIAALLRTTRTLTAVNVEGNSMGDEGAWAVATALRDFNTTVTTLDFGHSLDITDEVRHAVALLLARNRALPALRVAVARVVRLSEEAKLQEAAAAFGGRALQEAVFRFFLPSRPLLGLSPSESLS